jgi:sigma-54 specific flagellar transcriptional regulator A
MSSIVTHWEQSPGTAVTDAYQDTVPSGVVVISDDPEEASRLKDLLEFVEYTPVTVTDFQNWQQGFDKPANVLAVMLGHFNDNRLFDEFVRRMRSNIEEVPLILTVDKEEAKTISDQAAAGILYHLQPPVHFDEFSNVLRKCRVYRESRRRKGLESEMLLFRSLAGDSPAIQQVRRLMKQVAGTDTNVLILGESGTGKEVVARNLHYNSPRRNNPFVPINCGAIPPDLLESELFGHEKGAFTGAITARQGRFELAEGGTLFLDEIGDMPLNMQVKLLRVIQERTFERVGSSRTLATDVRIIAATHRDLEQHIAEGKFREDLYYRLNVFPIEMPPLRDRISDIPVLINELITRFEHENRGSVRLTPAAVLTLSQYNWPGNVRELANLVERLVILYPYGVVDVMDLPEKFRIPGTSRLSASDALDDDKLLGTGNSQPRLPKDGMDLKDFLSDLECNYIRQALDETNGVVAHAAKLLKMRRTTLVEKMRKYGLHRSEITPDN